MGRRPFLLVLLTVALTLLTLAQAPGRALATAPLALEVEAGASAGPSRVLWYGTAPVVLVQDKDGALTCIASDPGSLAFALAYLAGRRLPPRDAVRDAVGDAVGVDRLAALTAPPAGEVQDVLKDWSPSRLEILTALAAGLNLAGREAGREVGWTTADVAGLAAQPRALRRLIAGGTGLQASLAGPAAATRWGPALLTWVGAAILGEDHATSAIDAGSPAGVARGSDPAPGSGGLLWVSLRVSGSGQAEFRLPGERWQAAAFLDAPRPHWQTPIGPMLWKDDGFTLGLVYIAPDWRAGVERAGVEIDGLLAALGVFPQA